MEVFTAILPTVIEYTVGPIKKHMSYAFGFRSKVNTLRGEVNNLEAAIDSLQGDIEVAQRRGEEVKTIVRRWKTRAEEAIKEAEALIGSGDEEANRGCSLWLCLNLKSRYRIGKNAEDEKTSITNLLKEKGELGQISHSPDLQQIVMLPVEGYKAQSRTKILEEVIDALLDPNITMVGVYGMGGIGKTTLVKEVHQLATQNKLFDKVVMTRVTVEPNPRMIQDEIAEFVIGSKLEESSDSARASSLSQKLKDKRVLIILDDLWSKLDLVEGLGIPTGANGKGCKILLTSRNSDLLSEMRSQKNFCIQHLSNEESMSLFDKEVGEVGNREIAKKMVDKCAGFPLMIVTVAGLLRDKDMHVWNAIMTQLSKFNNQTIEEKVYSVLELSYNHLPDDTTKQIFLLCGICGWFGTTLQNLLRYSLGLGLFKCYTVNEAKDQLKTLIGHLKACSLVDVDELGNVKIHDIVRDAAITIACRDKRTYRAKDGNVLNEWPGKDDLCGCTKVSIPCNDIRQIPEDLGCPEVELLLLFCKQDTPFHIPDSTFQCTRQLKVVQLTGMGIASMPGSLCFLTVLHTLCLELCNLPNVATIGCLKSLEILSFRGSSLETLPIEIGQLTKLKLLDLSHCFKLRYIPANVISNLTSLEELLMNNSFYNWEIEEHGSGSNARLSELKCLSQLTSLEIRVPNTKTLPEDLFSNLLETYQILIGQGWNFDGYHKTIKTLRLNLGPSSDLLLQVRELLKELESLGLDGITEFTSLLYDNEGFPKLKELCIRNSSELQHIVDCRKRVTVICFPLLESLILSELESLVSICYGQPTSKSLSKIKKFEISNCNKLKNLLPISIVQNLSQLEEIEMEMCSGMEALFVDENYYSYERNEVAEFPRLRLLELSSLPQLKYFFNEVARESIPRLVGSSETTATNKLMPFFNEKVAIPCLEDFILRGIGNIQTIWCSQPSPSAFTKLNSLCISGCHGLQKVFPSEIGFFQKLKSLELRDCSLLEEIYKFGDYVVEELNNRPMIFGLNTLVLSNLPRLKHIWREDSTLEYFTFCMLESISIAHCEALENLMPPIIAKSLSRLKSLQVCNCSKLEEIVAQEFSCSLFPQLESLSLAYLPKLRSLRHIFACPNLKILTMRGYYKAKICRSLNEIEAFQRVGHPHSPNQQHFFSPEEVFPNLKEMSIDGRTYKSVFGGDVNLFNYLTRLESLELQSVPNLRDVFVRDSNIRELWRSGFDQPSLRVLKLFNVGGLRHTWPLLPYLKILEINSCTGFISLAAFPSASFQNLSTLEIWDCEKVIELIRPVTAKTMANLVTMRIQSCNALKEVVATEEQQQQGDDCIVFNKLKILELGDLEGLEGFCMSSCLCFNFPCLEEVFIVDCPSMRIFCNAHVITPKLRNIQLGHEEQYWEGDLNTTVKQLHEEFVFWRELRLSRFPQLVERWGTRLPFKLSSNLSELVVDKYALLPIAVPSNVLPSLSELRRLVVENCDSVEEIFDLDGIDQNQDNVGLMSKLETLELIELPKLRNVWNENALGILSFSYLRELKVHNCDNLTHICNLPVALAFVHLEELEVEECGLVEVIIRQEGGDRLVDWDQHTLFPSLKSMELENLPSLMGFYSSGNVMRCPALEEVNVGWPNLKRLTMRGCYKARICGSLDEVEAFQRVGHPHSSNQPQRFLSPEEVFPNLKKISIDGRTYKSVFGRDVNWFKYLTRLESIELHFVQGNLIEVYELESVPNLRDVAVWDSHIRELWRSEFDQRDASINSDQPSIRVLKLYNVEGLRHVWPLLPYLEILVLEECEDLISLAVSPSASFWNLSTLTLSFCNKVRELIRPAIAKTMANLVKLSISCCNALKEVVAAKEQQHEGDECIIFNKLKTLQLLNLESLEGFCMSSCHSFKFPCLEEVCIDDCHNMRIFCNGHIITPELCNIQLEDGQPYWNSDLNTTVKQLHKEFAFRSELRLSRYPQLVESWGAELPFKLSSNLSELVVDKCPLLPIALTSNVLTSLSELERLVVEKCVSVEEIFDLDRIDQNEDSVGLMSELETLELIELPKLRHVWNENALGILGFRYLVELKVHNCGNLIHIFSLPMALALVNLEELEVEECGLVEVIIRQEGGQRPVDWNHHTLFPSLESIELKNLPSLMGFYSGGDVMRCPTLEDVNIVGCPKICLFGSNEKQDENIMVQRPHHDGSVHKPTLCIFNNQVEVFNLKALTIQWNSSMDKVWCEIFSTSFLHGLEVIQLIDFPVVCELLPLDFAQGMPNLWEFIVSDSLCKQILPHRPSFVCEKQPVDSFAKLKYLELSNLPELEYIVKEDSLSASLFHHLEELQVSKCSRLAWLLTSVMAKGLVNLKKMVVQECERMAEIVSSNGDKAIEEIVFEQLESLELHGLPCLTSLSLGNYTFNFPWLYKVIVTKCPNMCTFAKNAPNAPILDYVQVGEDEDAWRWEDELNSTIEKLFKEMNQCRI